jgi:hypothetical protein
MTTPITSIFTAAYITQFLDLAKSITNFARNGDKAPSSPMASQSDIEIPTASKHLHELVLKLKTPEVPPRAGPFGSRNECANDFRLSKICTNCREVEERLRPYMSVVKKEITGEQEGAGKWGRFKNALKNAGSKQELDDIAKKIADLRDQNDWHVLALLKYVPCPFTLIRFSNRSR